jgi:hypothetical protein
MTGTLEAVVVLSRCVPVAWESDVDRETTVGPWSQAPPALRPDASCDPTKVGDIGTSS